MNKDKVEGKMKDVAGRVERQAGEWTGDTEQQLKGMGKQAEGKVQEGIGQAEDAGKKAVQEIKDRARQMESKKQQPKPEEEQDIEKEGAA
jgi:uncharacterized protein YjbJ (UPF0337 family)